MIILSSLSENACFYSASEEGGSSKVQTRRIFAHFPCRRQHEPVVYRNDDSGDDAKMQRALVVHVEVYQYICR